LIARKFRIALNSKNTTVPQTTNEPFSVQQLKDDMADIRPIAAADASIPDFLTELLRNDSSFTSVFISLLPEDEVHAIAIAGALDRNDHVDEIYLVLNVQTRPSRWRALLRVMETREKNDNVILIDNTPERLAVEMRSNIVAISAPFFEAMQRNKKTQKVSLSVGLSKEVLGAFLDATTGSLVALNFHSFDLDAADIPDVAKAIDRHESIKVLYMGCCNTTLQLLLSFVTCNSFFECLSFRMNDDSLDAAVLSQVLETTAKLKLHHIFFRRVQAETVFRAINDIIPKFTMQNLDIGCEVSGWNVTEAKQQLKAAVKKNFCLQKVRCYSERPELLNLADMMKLNFYTNRNNLLSEWIENPSTIPKTLWPNALRLAVEAGYGPLYRSLHAVAPETGLSKRSRKRKRPCYYDPSSCSNEKAKK
jgi:hypothetical protein